MKNTGGVYASPLGQQRRRGGTDGGQKEQISNIQMVCMLRHCWSSEGEAPINQSKVLTKPHTGKG